MSDDSAPVVGETVARPKPCGLAGRCTCSPGQCLRAAEPAAAVETVERAVGVLFGPVYARFPGRDPEWRRELASALVSHLAAANLLAAPVVSDRADPLAAVEALADRWEATNKSAWLNAAISLRAAIATARETAPAEATGLRERIEGAVEDALAGAATWQPGGWWLSLYAARKVSRRAIRAALAEATDGEPS